jgi:hypothetical protein
LRDKARARVIASIVLPTFQSRSPEGFVKRDRGCRGRAKAEAATPVGA